MGAPKEKKERRLATDNEERREEEGSSGDLKKGTVSLLALSRVKWGKRFFLETRETTGSERAGE